VPTLLGLYLVVNTVTVLSFLAIVGGVYFFCVGFQLLARKRLLLAIPNSRIRSAAMGLVEVNGIATGPHTIPAPLSGKPCFLYHTTAWQKPERKDDQWEKVADEKLHLPFFVDDTTGQLLVEPLGADLDLQRDFRHEYASSIFSTSDDAPLRVRAFLARHGVDANRKFRVEECTIKPQDPLFIAGTLSENPGLDLQRTSSRLASLNTEQMTMHQPAAIQASSATAGMGHGSSSQARGDSRGDSQSDSPEPQVINLYGGASPSSALGMTQQAKIAAALTRAGITKPEAWSAAGVPYQSVAVHENSRVGPLQVRSIAYSAELPLENTSTGANSSQGQSNPSSFNLSPPVVLMKGENDPTFVISYRSQKEFVSALAWKSMGMVWGGAAILLLGLYMLVLQLELF
jgi:hypothetical protein